MRRKVHLAVDEVIVEVQAVEFTGGQSDASLLPDLLGLAADKTVQSFLGFVDIRSIRRCLRYSST